MLGGLTFRRQPLYGVAVALGLALALGLAARGRATDARKEAKLEGGKPGGAGSRAGRMIERDEGEYPQSRRFVSTA